MKKHFSSSPLFLTILSVLAIGILSFTGASSSSAYSYYNNNTSYQGQGGNCPSYYHPACGEKAGQKTVYQNICTMNSAGATFVKWKTCGNNYSSYNYHNNWSNNYQNYYTQPQYVQPVYVSQPACTQEHNPVCALKNGYKKSYSNVCFARINGAQFLNYGECVKKQNTNTHYYNNNYHNNHYSHNNYYPVHNYSSFEISRYKNSRTNYSINKNSKFTISINAQNSNSTITHVIPDGIELLRITKGNCHQTFVYGGTRLKCYNTDGIQYTARANYNACQKKFSTTFSGYGYNSVYKNFTLTVK